MDFWPTVLTSDTPTFFLMFVCLWGAQRHYANMKPAVSLVNNEIIAELGKEEFCSRDWMRPLLIGHNDMQSTNEDIFPFLFCTTLGFYILYILLCFTATID